MNTRYGLGLALVLASTLGLLAQDPTPLLTRSEPELLSALQSADATLKDKMDACRELGVVGTKTSVPVLIKLLPDAEMSHMARYALETLPDPSVDKALRDALNELEGRQLAGVIDSLGARRDSRAVAPLGRLLNHDDPMVAQSAARALGSIGTAAASKTLLPALESTPEANRLALHEGLLRCAEALARDGRSRDAINVYQALRGDTNADHQVRAAAVRGLILEQPRDRGLQLLRESLNDPDYIVAAAAVRASQEMAGPDVTEALTAELGKLSADRQIVVLQNLGERGDIRALPAITAAAKHTDAAVRLEAVRSLAGMREPMVVPALVRLIQGRMRPWLKPPVRAWPPCLLRKWTTPSWPCWAARTTPSGRLPSSWWADARCSARCRSS
jgi:HEAT repeat protein